MNGLTVLFACHQETVNPAHETAATQIQIHNRNTTFQQATTPGSFQSLKLKQIIITPICNPCSFHCVRIQSPIEAIGRMPFPFGAFGTSILAPSALELDSFPTPSHHSAPQSSRLRRSNSAPSAPPSCRPTKYLDVPLSYSQFAVNTYTLLCIHATVKNTIFI